MSKDYYPRSPFKELGRVYGVCFTTCFTKMDKYERNNCHLDLTMRKYMGQIYIVWEWSLGLGSRVLK